MMKLHTSSGRQKMPAALALALAALCMVGVFTAGPAEARQNKWNNWGGHGHNHHKWHNHGGYNYGGYDGGYYYYPQPYVQYAPPPVYYAPPPPVYYAPPPPVYYQPPPLFSVIIPLRID